MSFILAAAETAEHEPAIHPYVVGLIAFVVLMALLTMLLTFGKGREHS